MHKNMLERWPFIHLGIMSIAFVLIARMAETRIVSTNTAGTNLSKKQMENKLFAWGNIEISADLNFYFRTNTTSESKIALKVYLGQLMGDAVKKRFSREFNDSSLAMTFHDGNLKTSLTLRKLAFHEKCYEIRWLSHSPLQDCFDARDYHWYGLGEIFSQYWPLEKVPFDMTPFVTSDFLAAEQTSLFGGVLEPFIINSKGGGVYISDKAHLLIGIIGKKLCIRTNGGNSMEVNDKLHELKYTACFANNVKEVHSILFNRYIEKPRGIPDIRMITKPIWSTWARYKTRVDQRSVLEFADEIKRYQFPASHIEIDDKYSTSYGDYNFDKKKFPNITYMIGQLKQRDFRVAAWVYPFCNIKSECFQKSLKYTVKVGRQKVPGLIKWWNGIGTMLDTTNAKSGTWFLNTLKEFKKLGLDGFKFDAGEANYLPLNYQLEVPQNNPNYFSQHYVRLASQTGSLTEVRVGYKSQKYPVFVRMLDRSSTWGIKNGLRSVLTASLTLSILGYPFVLPDMVGGNSYIMKPSPELYIRWTQLCIFLPAIQFSIAPWDYNDSVVDIVRQALYVRQNISAYTLQLAEEVKQSGDPIVRPLWWYWPVDKDALLIDTQFMLGNRYLIAPVMHLQSGHTVYLPAGVWEEQWGKKRILRVEEGEHKRYIVTLRDIVYFKLIEFLQQ